MEISYDERDRQRHPDHSSDLLFTGSREDYSFTLDARNGASLWKTALGGQIAEGPITYQVDGKQYVTIASGWKLVTES